MPARILAALAATLLLLLAPTASRAVQSAPIPEPGATDPNVSLGGLTASGWNAYGQLGTASTTAEDNHWPVGAARDWTSVATGYASTCAIRIDGTLWCWGYGPDGRLGNGTASRTAPTQVGSAIGWRKVTVGYNHACAIAADRSLWCWGSDAYGKLGDGPTTSAQKNAPVRIGTTGWVDIAAGQDSTCGITVAGSLWCWGFGGAGQLGNGSSASVSTPTQVGTDLLWARVTEGAYHSCATKTDGTLWCWGSGAYGKLGTGNGTTQQRPARVGTADTWNQPSAGLDSTCATRTDGTLWCWGYGGAGQLGNGGTNSPTVPTQVPSDVEWATVASSRYSTCATKVDATLWCWGANGNGQLGLGTTGGQRTTPVQLATPATASAISSGPTALHTAFVTDDAYPVNACPNVTTTKSWASQGDNDPYILIPGGGFEPGEQPWTLNNAATTSGNESLGVTSGTTSLKLGTASGQAASATSPEFCVNDAWPTLRLALRGTRSSGNITVIVRFHPRQNPANTSDLTSQTIALNSLTGSWTASPKLPLAKLLSADQIHHGGTVELILRTDATVATAGGLQVDAISADPR